MALTPSILFVTLTATILILIAIVVILEKSLKKRKEIETKDPAYEFTDELRALKKSNIDPQEMMIKIDSLAKRAITGQNIAGHMDYSQLSELNKEKHHIVQFCSEMTESLYAGERITPTQAKNLMNALEDLLKGEGKLILITPKKEIIEGKSTFFLDKIIEDWAKKVNLKIQEIKERKAAKESEIKPMADVEKKELENREESIPEYKKEVMIKKDTVKRKKADADKLEYKYIESVDVLDRIQNKLKERKAVKV